MNNSKFFSNDLINYNKNWKIISDLFNNFCLNSKDIKLLNYKIPKIIHQIWLGSPFPEKYKKFQKSWIDNHPDWEYKLWIDKDIDNLYLENKDLYYSTNNYGEKSDILRYEILYKFGGLYVDTDFECLKSFDVLNKLCTFYAGIGHNPDPVILSGLIGSIPQHPILKICIKNMKKTNNSKNAFLDILTRTSIFHFTKCFFEKYDSESIIFPVSFFYSLPDFEKKNNIKKYIKPESFAIHYWELSWNNGKTY